MRNHLDSVYLKAGAIAHVQSTTGDHLPREVIEFDEKRLKIPLTRIDLELEPDAEEIREGKAGRPRHRKASDLFQNELEFRGGKVRYRRDAGRTERIITIKGEG